MNRLIFRSLLMLSLLCISLLSARQVRADTINYTFVQNLMPPTGGVVTNTFTWTLSTLSVPPVSGDAITFNGVSIIENNGAPMMGTLDFFDSAQSGGFDLLVGGNFLSDNSGDPVTPGGPFTQFFSGPDSAPSLDTGTFGVTEFGLNTDPGTGTLTATPGSTSVPEPSTMLLSAVGLVIGLALTVLRKN